MKSLSADEVRTGYIYCGVPSADSNAERPTPNFLPASSFLHKQSPFQPLKRKACLFFTLFCGTGKENLFNSQDLFELVDHFSFSSRAVCLIEQFYFKENWMSGDVLLGVKEYWKGQ